jgi:hypothetical protein
MTRKTYLTAAPWMLMFKQDAVLASPDNQIWIRNDNETASVNLVDPSAVNLFSNLDQMIHLKESIL